MSDSGVRQLLFVFFGFAAVQVLFVLASFAAAAVVSVRVTSAAVGTLRVATFRPGGVELRIGLLPLTSWVSLSGMGPLDSYDGPGSWRRVPVGGRLVVILAPWVVTMTIALICLGFDRAVGSFLRAPGQVFLMLDATLVRGFRRVVATEPFSVTLGIVCAKLAALNLLPVPNMSGGAVVAVVLGALRPPSPSAEVRWSQLKGVSMVVIALYVLTRLAWAFANSF